MYYLLHFILSICYMVVCLRLFIRRLFQKYIHFPFSLYVFGGKKYDCFSDFFNFIDFFVVFSLAALYSIYLLFSYTPCFTRLFFVSLVILRVRYENTHMMSENIRYKHQYLNLKKIQKKKTTVKEKRQIFKWK